MPLQGIVELLGQQGSLSWAESVALPAGSDHENASRVSVHRHPLRFAPKFLENTSGSCQLSALNRSEACPDKVLDAAATSSCRFAVFVVCTDGAASCTRMKMAIAESLATWNATSAEMTVVRAVAVLFLICCVAHFLNNDIENTAGTSKIISSLYATAWAISIADVQSQMADAWARLASSDLEMGFLRGRSPKPGQEADNEILARWLIPRAVGRLPSDLLVVEYVKEFAELFNCPMRGDIISLHRYHAHFYNVSQRDYS